MLCAFVQLPVNCHKHVGLVAVGLYLNISFSELRSVSVITEKSPHAVAYMSVPAYNVVLFNSGRKLSNEKYDARLRAKLDDAIYRRQFPDLRFWFVYQCHYSGRSVVWRRQTVSHSICLGVHCARPNSAMAWIKLSRNENDLSKQFLWTSSASQFSRELIIKQWNGDVFRLYHHCWTKHSHNHSSMLIVSK